MIKKLTILLLALAATANCLAAEKLANDHKAGLDYDSIEEILALEDKEIDLATAVLSLSRRWNPYTDVRGYRRLVDEMAMDIRDILKQKRSQTGPQTIAVINDYLFNDAGFTAIDTAENPRDLFLNTVIDSRQGYCLSLSILYLCIGERLGIPLHGVVVPGHFFVRFGSGKRSFNIETTQNGAFATDQHYITRFKVPDTSNNIYMQNLKKKQTIGCFFNNLGNVYYDDGDIENAFYYQKLAVKINPSLSEARTNLGNIYSDKNIFPEAIENYKIALRINPSDAKTHYNLANTYKKTEKFDSAIKHYKTSLSLDPNYIETYKNLAQSYFAKDKHAYAIRVLTDAIQIDSDDPDIYTDLANIYQDLADYPKAISNYQIAIALKPENPRACYALAHTYFKSDMFYEAIEQFQAAIYYEPENANAYFALAITYNKLEWTKNEIDAYKKALFYAPDMLEAHQNIGTAYMAQEDYQSALKHYQHAVNLAPQNPQLHYGLALAFSNLNMLPQAKNSYLNALDLNPEYPEANYNIAIILYNLEEYGDSLKYAQTAKTLGMSVPQVFLEQLYEMSKNRDNDQ